MSLPYDYARCNGVREPQCDDCLRRTSPGHDTYQVYLLPPDASGTACPYRIEPRAEPCDARGRGD